MEPCPELREQSVSADGRNELSTSVKRGLPEPIFVRVVREASSADLQLPHYRTAEAAGMDLIAAIPVNSSLTLQPLQRALVPTGLRLEIPEGYEAQIRPRSGIALKHGIGMVNSPGTIDSDYRGEIGVLLINWGSEPFTISRGDRIAQLVFTPISRVTLVEVETLTETERGAGGFGSTGVGRE